MENTPVERVDILSFAGKWYTLYSISTFMDKHWRQTTETYVIHPDGYYAVFTNFKVAGENTPKYIRSKLYVVKGTNNAEFKLQFLWPFKVDYWIIELAEDYSYAVIGHPEHKFLFIISRKPYMDQELLDGVIYRCKQRGYDTSKLIYQEHPVPSMSKEQIN